MEKFTYRDNVMKKLDNSGEKLWMWQWKARAAM